MAKPRQLKPWPELVGLLPLLKADEPRLKVREVGHLDLENVFAVDALGLTLYLAKLAQFLSADHSDLYLTLPADQRVNEKLKLLRFGTLLNEIANVKIYEDLFSAKKQNTETNTTPVKNFFEEIIQIKTCEVKDRNTALQEIKKNIKNFLKNDTENKFAHQQIMVILLELVKNTLDHAGSTAYLGLQINVNKFSFNYADTGQGIVSSVRKHLISDAARLSNSDRSEDVTKISRLAEKGGFSDFIQWAFKPGNSTKIGNGINFGFGLMMIVQASKNCGIRLALRDADSYLILSQAGSDLSSQSGVISHTLIRQRLVTTNARSVLVFHGVLDATGI